MLDTPFAPWPTFAEDERAAVEAVLRSGRVNYWTGDTGRAFEREFAAWCGAKHAVALANGTVALDLALKVLGIGPGDEVVVTPRTFLASASCIANAGATPVFADVDRDSQNVTAESIARVLTPRTRAIECVHLAGWPCEMGGIMALAKERGLLVIEDCAQAVGARYRGRPVGTFGEAAAWSFCQDKILTTGGEGGMLTTADRALWSAAWSYKDHGKSWEAVFEREHPLGFKWVHESFGTNWRMTELQAAIGRVQLGKLPDWLAARRRNAQAILGAARECAAFRVPEVPAHLEHAWYKAYAFVEPERLKGGWDRDRIVAEINERGVPCSMGSCSEVYLEKAFDGTGFRPAERLPVARELGETSVMFLVHPTLTGADVVRTCEAIREVGRAALG
jgi:dTDP-4-amino-4,6-dideoxygalactose transaminase